MTHPFNAGRPKKRLFLTMLVGIVFFWFWSQGPLNKPTQLVNLVTNSSKFLVPTFIQDKNTAQQKEFGLIQTEAHEYTSFKAYKLVGKKRPLKTHGLIADPNHQPSMVAEVGEAILKHARLFNPSLTVQLKHALDMFYVEQRHDEKHAPSLYIESTGLTEHIKGYAGSITLGINLSSEGKIDSVHYISSQETSSYLRQIKEAGFYQQFIGILLDGESHQIDAISGATISTQAIARTITSLLNKASESPLSLYMEDDPAGTKISAELTNEWIIQISLITALFIYFWQPWLIRTRLKTTGIMLFSALYIGFYSSVQKSVSLH